MMEDQPLCGLGDIACYCDRLATFLTKQAWNVIKTLVDASVLSPASVVIQTPPGVTYQNAQVQQMVTWELGRLIVRWPCSSAYSPITSSLDEAWA